jgi:hypothetical protein
MFYRKNATGLGDAVNEFGMSHFPTGFGRVPPPPPIPPRGDSGNSKPFLVLLLIIACVGAGALLAWGLKEHDERARFYERSLAIEKSYVVVLANRTDLASFLTDQRTRLFRLTGRGEATGRSATIAWQEETHSGILIADRVAPPPDHAAYLMWHLDANQRPSPCGSFKPDPTGTFYDFRDLAPDQDTGGFVISLESNSNITKPSQIVYETR